MQKIKDIYEKENGEFYIVELEADLEERLKRNKTENRLKNKPTKRDLQKKGSGPFFCFFE